MSTKPNLAIYYHCAAFSPMPSAFIKAIDTHFALEQDNVRVLEITNQLPDSFADLVDKRCSLGGLKYLDLTMYTVFGVIENVFASLTTPVNFTMFGGMLLVDL